MGRARATPTSKGKGRQYGAHADSDSSSEDRKPQVSPAKKVASKSDRKRRIGSSARSTDESDDSTRELEPKRLKTVERRAQRNVNAFMNAFGEALLDGMEEQLAAPDQEAQARKAAMARLREQKESQRRAKEDKEKQDARKMVMKARKSTGRPAVPIKRKQRERLPSSSSSSSSEVDAATLVRNGAAVAEQNRGDLPEINKRSRSPSTPPPPAAHSTNKRFRTSNASVPDSEDEEAASASPKDEDDRPTEESCAVTSSLTQTTANEASNTLEPDVRRAPDDLDIRTRPGPYTADSSGVGEGDPANSWVNDVVADDEIEYVAVDQGGQVLDSDQGDADTQKGASDSLAQSSHPSNSSPDQPKQASRDSFRSPGERLSQSRPPTSQSRATDATRLAAATSEEPTDPVRQAASLSLDMQTTSEQRSQSIASGTSPEFRTSRHEKGKDRLATEDYPEDSMAQGAVQIGSTYARRVSSRRPLYNASQKNDRLKLDLRRQFD